MAADLHCHTKLSDGSVGIEDVICIAKKSGIDTIAITDHDCLAGTVRAQVISKRYDVRVVPGVELSAFDNEAGKKVHILSYLADAPDRLEGLCKRTSIARKRAGQIMMLKVASRFPVSSEFIIAHAAFPHILPSIAACIAEKNLWLIPDNYMTSPGYPARNLWAEGINYVQGRHMLFGTAYPYLGLKQNVEGVKAFNFRKEYYDKYMYQNALEILEM